MGRGSKTDKKPTTNPQAKPMEPKQAQYRLVTRVHSSILQKPYPFTHPKLASSDWHRPPPPVRQSANAPCSRSVPPSHKVTHRSAGQQQHQPTSFDLFLLILLNQSKSTGFRSSQAAEDGRRQSLDAEELAGTRPPSNPRTATSSRRTSKPAGVKPRWASWAPG